jgi:hypothetical protein
MGFIKDVKATTAASHAARARQESRTVFLYRHNVPATSSGFSGPITDAAEVIESIERTGWQLNQVAYDGHQSKNGAVLLLFRAARNQPPPGPAYAPQHGAGIPGSYQQ